VLERKRPVIELNTAAEHIFTKIYFCDLKIDYAVRPLTESVLMPAIPHPVAADRVAGMRANSN
jgi:hypothetical protein